MVKQYLLNIWYYCGEIDGELVTIFKKLQKWGVRINSQTTCLLCKGDSSTQTKMSHLGLRPTKRETKHWLNSMRRNLGSVLI